MSDPNKTSQSGFGQVGGIWVGTGPSSHDNSIPPGSLIFTGLAVSLLFVLATPAGALNFTTYAPTLRVSIVKSVPAGSLVFTGKQPGHRPIVPAGSLTFTGFAPLPNIIVPRGTLTFTGLAPSIVNTVSVPLGHLTFTGYVPILPDVKVPAAASLVFTGFAPALVESINLSVPKGTLVFTPTGVTLGPIIPLGHLTFTGFAPAANIPFNIPVGSLVFIGLAPTLFNGPQLIPATANLILSPKSLSIYITGPFPTGSLVFTGYPPRITGDVPRGTLIFTGQPVVLLHGEAHLVPLGTLVFTTYAPTLSNSAFPVVGAGSAGRVWVISFEDRTLRVEPPPMLVTSEERTDDAD